MKASCASVAIEPVTPVGAPLQPAVPGDTSLEKASLGSNCRSPVRRSYSKDTGAYAGLQLGTAVHPTCVQLKGAHHLLYDLL